MTTRLAGYRTHQQRELELNELLEGNELLAENYAAAAAAILSMKAEDVGWLPINRIDREDGFTLEALKEIAEYAELQATGNPLLKRGFTLRRDNVFGKGIQFETAKDEPKISERIKGVLERPANQNALFSRDAFSRNERAAYTAGNLFMAYRDSTDTFFPIPLEEISNFASNPDVAGEVWYYERTYTEIDQRTMQPKTAPTVEWYPVLERWEERGKKPLRKTIAGHKVVPDVRVVDFKVNTVIGRVWGVPDVLPAMPYAWAHAEYIRDASKLLKALSTIAWKIVSRSKGNAINASAQVAAPKRQGSTVAMTEGTDMVSVPKAGQVDMKDGQTIAAYVAAALEVPLLALLPDAGSAAGSYAAAATLDGPTTNTARNRQEQWADFYKRIYRALGVKKIAVNFPKINEEPLYRQGQLLQIGFAYGALHQDEFRTAFLEIADISPLHPEVPEPSPFTTAAQYSVEAQEIDKIAAERDAEIADQAARTAANVQGQGVSKPAGAGTGGDNSNRDSSAKAGRK